MIGQTLAIFHDAYRELNARKMFWIVLFLSGFVVLAFAAVGINDKGVTILGWEFDFPINTKILPRETFYKAMFTSLGVGFWLTWIATVLALISTAGIFPDFVSGGSIDLFLSKPISRLRLFLTKYAAGLLFVTLQVTIFSAASFLVIGIRGGAWLPGLFLAVPVVVCFFSYLFAVCVLVGVLTRSTVAALLLTILFWFGILGVHVTELLVLKESVKRQQQAAQLDKSVARAERELKAHDDTEAASPNADPAAAALRRQAVEQRLQSARDRRAAVHDAFAPWHRMFLGVKTVLPKTSETVELLNRWLKVAADLPEPEPAEEEFGDNGPDLFGRRAAERAADEEVARRVTTRSVAWVLGTSLAFEAVVLAVAAWVFCRRDY